MSTITRASRHEPHAPARTLLVQWSISRPALHRARPDLIPSPTGPAIILSWQLAADRTGTLSGDAVLMDGPRAIPVLSLIDGPRAGLDGSIDIPGLLTASFIGTGGDGIRYAKTGLFTAWAVPGGRYELLRDTENG